MIIVFKKLLTNRFHPSGGAKTIGSYRNVIQQRPQKRSTWKLSCPALKKTESRYVWFLEEWTIGTILNLQRSVFLGFQRYFWQCEIIHLSRLEFCQMASRHVGVQQGATRRHFRNSCVGVAARNSSWLCPRGAAIGPPGDGVGPGGRVPGMRGRRGPRVVRCGGLGAAARGRLEQPHVDVLGQPHGHRDLLVEDLADGLDVDGVLQAAAGPEVVLEAVLAQLVLQRKV